jgi:hypothetical protein
MRTVLLLGSQTRCRERRAIDYKEIISRIVKLPERTDPVELADLLRSRRSDQGFSSMSVHALNSQVCETRFLSISFARMR